MTYAAPVESFEVERKYAVDAAAELPTAEAFAATGFAIEGPQPNLLEAQYFDTAELDLGAMRLAVRRRRGGKDEGWHLKEKGDAGARELLWPPADCMPEGLTALIEERIGEAASRIGAIASLRTVRAVYRVHRDGEEVVEIVDDRVDAVNELTGHRQRWREWEAELVPGADEALLDDVERVLERAGARRVRGTSKIQRTMSGE